MTSPKSFANEIVIEISPAETLTTTRTTSAGDLHEKAEPAAGQAYFHAGDTIALESFDAKTGTWLVQINGQPFSKGRLRITAELEFDGKTFPQTVV
jgi:hypothetical protein